MQTPRGFTRLPDGRFEVTSFFGAIFTPSFPYRLDHTVSAFLVTTAAFVILGVGVLYTLQKRAQEESRVMLKMSLIFLIIMVPIQMVIGDAHGINTFEHQPAKLAAMEGLWESGTRIPANIFSIPDQEEERNHFEISISVLGSLYLTHDPNGYVKGTEGLSARGPSACRSGVLRVPHHGRRRAADVRARTVGHHAFRARQAGNQHALAAGRDVVHAARFYRRAGRLDDHRSGPSAVDGLRSAAHERFGDALAHRRRRRPLVAAVHARLSRDLRRGFHSAAADRARRSRGGLARA